MTEGTAGKNDSMPHVIARLHRRDRAFVWPAIPTDYCSKLLSIRGAPKLSTMSQGAGKRREKRIAAALPIRLWGLDARGRPFIEAAKTTNVSRSGVLLKGLPTKLVVGDTIGLRCQEKKYRFRVVWIAAEGTPEAGNIGLQSLESGKWIWEDLNLPADDQDVYARPPQEERRLVNRVRCFLSAEVVCDRPPQRVMAFVRDLSVGGCYIAMPFPFPLETTVSIALWLDEQTKIWADGIVISSHPSTGMGVKFLGLSRQNLEAIDGCVKQLSHADADTSFSRLSIPPGRPSI